MLKITSKQYLNTHINTSAFVFRSRFSYAFRRINLNFSTSLRSFSGSTKDHDFFFEKYKDDFYFPENKLCENFLILLTLEFKSNPFTCIDICTSNEFALDLLLSIKSKFRFPHERIQLSACYLIDFGKDDCPVYRSTKVNFLNLYTTEKSQTTQDNVSEVEDFLSLALEDINYEDYFFIGLRITAQATTK